MIYFQIALIIVVVICVPILLTFLGEYLYSTFKNKKYRVKNKKNGFNKTFTEKELYNVDKVYENYLRKEKLKNISDRKLKLNEIEKRGHSLL